MNTKVIDFKRWLMAAALLIMCSLASTGHTSEEKIEQLYFDQFRTNYLQPKTEFLPLGVQDEILSAPLSSAFGLDNAGLDRAAEDLANNRMPSSHRFMNRHWLYMETHQVRWQRGSTIITAYLKSKARAYWDSMMHAREQKRAAAGLPKPRGQMIYDMDMTSDSLEFFVTYEF